MKADLVEQLARAAVSGRPDAVQDSIRLLSEDEKSKGNDRIAQQLRLIASGVPSRLSGLSFPQQPHGIIPTMVPAPTDDDWEVVMPRETLADVVVDEATRARLARVAHDLANQDRLRDWGVADATRLLLHGPPGTGKTLAARAVAHECQRPLIVLHLDEVLSSYLGETSKNVAAAFVKAQEAGAIILLDEVDALAKSRDDSHEVGELKRVVNSILQILDRTRDTVPVLAATNHAPSLDPAIWRRFSDILEFQKPDVAHRESMVASFLARVPTSLKEWTPAMVATMTEGFTGSDLRRMVLNATREALHSQANAVQDTHLTMALKESVRMVHGEDVPLSQLKEICEVVRLSQKGLPYRQIARQLGFASPSTVHDRLKAVHAGRLPRGPRLRTHRNSQ